jgi:hypothetical protein
MKTFCLLLIPALTAAAQSPMGYPRAGCFRDGAGLLRPVLGIAGNFLIGDAEASGVIAAACRGRLILVKTADALGLRDRESGRELKWPAPAGGALFAFPADGSAPLAFFPATSEWLRTEEGASARTLPAIEGEPVAMWSEDDVRAGFVVRREGGLFAVRISLASGVVEAETALAESGPVLPLGGGMLLAAEGTGLVVREPFEEERRIALPAPAAAIEQMGEGWVRIVLEGGGHMALRMASGGDELYQLPEVKQ